MNTLGICIIPTVLPFQRVNGRENNQPRRAHTTDLHNIYLHIYYQYYNIL